MRAVLTGYTGRKCEVVKKIINGKIYDTDTAKLVGEWYNGCYANDFNYCSEDLYQKRTGEFFIFGEGGANSKYSKSRGNNEWCGGEKIVPLSFDAAKEWVEDHLTGDEYKEIFCEVEDDETKKCVSFYIKSANAQNLKLAAAKKEISISALIDQLIETL